MSRSNDVGAPCLNETWGSSSMFSSDCLDLPGFWNKKLGILGALGSLFTFIGTVTIIPLMPDGWAASAWRISRDGRKRGFPDERCGPASCVDLSPEAECCQSRACS